MKRLIGILTAIVVLSASAALAGDLSALTDNELKALLVDVSAELDSRGIGYGRKTAPEGAGDTQVPPGGENTAEIAGRVGRFFELWSMNRSDDMLQLCTRSWKAQQENPRTALFGLLANRTAAAYELLEITGEEEDTARYAFVEAEVDRNNGAEPVRYRFAVRVRKDMGGLWNIDPESLGLCMPVKEADLAENARAIVGRLTAFLMDWNLNRTTEAAARCAPEWAEAQYNPVNAFFALQGNRIPLAYAVAGISGTEEDTARTVTVDALIERNNGRDPEWFRMEIGMVLAGDGLWYVDPLTLQYTPLSGAEPDSP